MIAALPYLPNYLKAFRSNGPAAFWRVHRPKREGQLFSTKVGGETYWLRNTASDRSVFFQVIVQQEYETQHWPALHERLQAATYHRLLSHGKTPIIIDAGANIGLSARWFAARYPKAKIIAIEPDDANIIVLRRNAEGHQNITAIHGAVWDRDTALHISNPEAGSASFHASEGVGTVQAYTIPQILAQTDGELFIAKIDIEGGEDALFRSNTEWLAHTGLLVVELHDWLYPGQGTSRHLFKQISEHQFDVVFRADSLFCFAHD